MAKSQILTGARAIIQITASGDENQKFTQVAFFTTCNWSVRQDKVPAFILGRYNPSEITPTAQEPVAVSMTGYRVPNHGPYADVNAVKLKEMLNEDDFSVQVLDRRTGKQIFTAEGCRVTGWSSGVAARGVSDLRIDVLGIVAGDESNEGDEDDGGILSAPSIPSP